MPPRSARSSRGRGRARGQTPSYSHSNPPITPQLPFVGTPYAPSANQQPSIQFPQPSTQVLLPAIHQQTEEDVVDRRLDEAAMMIHTPENEIDILNRHQQRRNISVPAQNRLWDFAAHPYPRPQSETTSSRPPSTTTSHSRIPYATGLETSKMSSFDRLTQKILRTARSLVVNDMAIDVGWLYGDDRQAAFMGNMEENFSSACDKHQRDLEWQPREFGPLIAKGVRDVRSKLAEFAERYAKQYFEPLPTAIKAMADRAAEINWMQEHMNIITDQTDRLNCFLHERQETDDHVLYFGNPILREFHTAFWYTRNESPIRSYKKSYHTTPAPMLALSAAAMLCAIHRVASGQESRTSSTPIKFEGARYGPYYDTFLEGINQIRLNPLELGDEFRSRLRAMHDEGIKLLNAKCGGPGSPRKVAAVYIPECIQAAAHQPNVVADAGSSLPNPFVGHSTQPSSTVALASTSSAFYGPPLSLSTDTFIDHSSFASSSTSAGPNPQRDHATTFSYSYFDEA